MKLCCRCKLNKSFFDFNKDKKRKDGHCPMCKLCCKNWRLQNKESLSKRKKTYYAQPKVVERTKKYRAKYYQNNKTDMRSKQQSYYAIPENRAKKLYSKTKERALLSGIDFNIELSDIIIPKYCPYLNVELTHDIGKGHVETNSSIDRIDSTKGYVKGNVQVISLLANQMKNSATQEQLLAFAHSILEKARKDNETDDLDY